MSEPTIEELIAWIQSTDREGWLRAAYEADCADRGISPEPEDTE
jgi:antibiotic biosynthesis monooxygenase (ABM) superfamily enzyme